MKGSMTWLFRLVLSPTASCPFEVQFKMTSNPLTCLSGHGAEEKEEGCRYGEKLSEEEEGEEVKEQQCEQREPKKVQILAWMGEGSS